MTDLFRFFIRDWSRYLEWTLEHLQVVAISIVFATTLGLTIAVLSYRSDRATIVALGTTSAFLTVPSYALFGLLIPLLGLGWRPAIAALTGYALMPIVRNTIIGLRGVESQVLEAAQGMGMSRLQILRRVELPLAWPVIITGIRIAAILIISIAAIAALVDGPGLGNPIIRGLARMGGAGALPLALWGTVLIVVVALVLDGIFRLLTRVSVSPGIRT